MNRVIDFSGRYRAAAGEYVVRANIRFIRVEDLKEYDKVVANERDREYFKGIEGVTFIKPPARSGGRQSANSVGGEE